MSTLVASAALAAGETDIHLTETATRMMAPDRIRATLRLDVTGKSARDVQAQLNQRMSAALAKAKSVAGVTASTGYYGVNRMADNTDTWQGSQSLTLTGADFAAVLTLAGSLQEAGLAMAGVDFHLAAETLKGAESALTADALAALQARATEVAQDMGLRVDRFSRIEIGNALAGGGPMPQVRMLGMSSARPMVPPVAEAAASMVSLTVSADVALTGK